MVEQWMIDDMHHERQMIMWFMLQKRCYRIRFEMLDCINDVVRWLMNPTITDYPALCSKTAELSETAWAHIHGYLPPRDDKRGAA